MKNLETGKILSLLYDNPGFSEVACMFGGNALNIGDSFQTNSYFSVNTTKYTSGPEVTPSRILQSFDNPDFIIKEFSKTRAVGYVNIEGEKEKWLATLDESDSHMKISFSVSADKLTGAMALYPAAALMDARQTGFREIRDNPKRDRSSALRYSECFKAFVLCRDSIDIEYGVNLDDVDEPAQKIAAPKAACDLPWFNDDGIPNDLSVSSALKGKYRLSFPTEFSSDLVPLSFLEGYVDNPDFRNVLEQAVGYLSAMKRKGATESFSLLQNFMLVGEPGTGKTMLVRAIAAALGLPILIVRLGDRSEKDEITQEVRVTESGFQTVKSRCYHFIKDGGIVLFDDITNADPNMFFSVMGGVFESPFEYYVGNECVKRHPMSLFFATANIGTVGSEAMNEALLTRFGNHYVVSRLSEDKFIRTIETRALLGAGYEGVDMKKLHSVTKWVYATFERAEKLVAQYSADTSNSLLSLRAAVSIEEMVLNAWANGFVPDLKRYARQAFANIMYSGGNENIAKSLADAIDALPDTAF